MPSTHAPGVEFYQDNDETTYSREQLEPSNRDRCGPNNVSKLRRELIPGTMEVYPLQNYGALQIARHNFFIMNSTVRGRLAAASRFVHI